MTGQSGSKLNHLLRAMPRGTIATQDWLATQGVSRQLADSFTESQWLERVGRGAYKRVDDKNVGWLGGVWALQRTVPVHVGAKTALEEQGFAHFIPMSRRRVWLFGPQKTKLPHWFVKNHWDHDVHLAATNLFSNNELGMTEHRVNDFTVRMSAPERAMFETLYLVPNNQSLNEAFQLMEGMTTLRPRLLDELLAECNSLTVRRVFMVFAHRLRYPWYKKLHAVDLGEGKRAFAGGGKYHPSFQISLPEFGEQ